MSKKKTPAAAPAGAQSATKLVIKSRERKTSPGSSFSLPFGKKNFVHLLIGIGILMVGYALMTDKEYKGAEEFSMALHVAPVIVLAGYAYLVYAILLKDKKAPKSSGSAQTGN
ncbi:MAG: DUF3098 domain-containing protein [Bacteroidetes bacterium]|nr:DUF3098 domain-containing protein [Bacteroidota bacterium]